MQDASAQMASWRMSERPHVWNEWPDFFRGIARVRHQLERYLAGMPDPLLEQSVDRIYFTDASGRRWRIHDVTFGPPFAKPQHYRRFDVGDGRALNRVFVSAGGARRSHRFERQEPRAVTVSDCARRLERAGFLSDAPIAVNSRWRL